MAKRRKRRNWRNYSKTDKLNQDEIDKTVFERERLSTRSSRWRERLEEELELEEQKYNPEDYQGYPLGTVISMLSGHHYVRLEDSGEVIDCRIRGTMKRAIFHTTTAVSPGDQVHIEQIPEGGGVIVAVVPRKTAFSRPDPFRTHLQDVIVANVDQLIIVSSVGGPAFWPELVDRYLVFAEYNEMKPLVVVNKADLAATDELDEIEALYAGQLGYQVLFTSVETGKGIENLKEAMQDRSSVITGLSGVGKSSLLNVLQPGLKLKVRSVNVAYGGEGKHTTRSTTLYPLDFGGYVADTPGIRAFGVWDITPEEVDYYFVDFRPYLSQCKFSDCTHHNEPGCAVLQALEDGNIAESRYNSFLELYEETDPAMERPF